MKAREHTLNRQENKHPFSNQSLLVLRRVEPRLSWSIFPGQPLFCLLRDHFFLLRNSLIAASRMEPLP